MTQRSDNDQNNSYVRFRTYEFFRTIRSTPAHTAGVPTAPAYAGGALTVGSNGPLGSPLMGRDASLGFRDLSFQDRDVLLYFVARTGDIASPEVSDFQGLHGVAVLPN